MKSKKIMITQSNYIPWKGYFDAIRLVDEVILYDDMQYTKRDWRNRNQIKGPNGAQWISIPVEVKGKYFQSIKETKISDQNWGIKHWKMIQANYSKATFFKEYKNLLEDLYTNCDEKYLSLINYHFLEGINNILGISTQMRFSSDFILVDGKTERLIDLCKQLKCTDYYTGPAAKNYINEALFEQENIEIHYLDYTGYPEYPQLFPPFEHGVTVLDLILNTGSDAVKYMKEL